MTTAPPPAPPAPGQPDLPGQPKRAVGLAIASLVLGVCGVIPCLGILLGLVGIILGIVALAKKTSSSGMAIGGIVAGAATILIVQGLTTLVPAISMARVMAKQAVCQTNLLSVGTTMVQYQIDNDDSFPQDLSTLTREGYASDSKIFRCPMADGSRAIDYFYLPPLTVRPRHDTVIACDFVGNHKGEGRSVLLASGSVLWMTEEQFQSELKKPINARFAAALPMAEGP